MAHGHDDDRNLSITWPFSFAGLCLLVALVWFCLGFAIKDRKLPEPAVTTGPTELPGHLSVFWILLLVGAVSVAFGLVVNLTRARRRETR